MRVPAFGATDGAGTGALPQPHNGTRPQAGLVKALQLCLARLDDEPDGTVDVRLRRGRSLRNR